MTRARDLDIMNVRSCVPRGCHAAHYCCSMHLSVPLLKGPRAFDESDRDRAVQLQILLDGSFPLLSRVLFTVSYATTCRRASEGPSTSLPPTRARSRDRRWSRSSDARSVCQRSQSLPPPLCCLAYLYTQGAFSSLRYPGQPHDSTGTR